MDSKPKPKPPPDPLMAVLGPAIKVGLACGGAGFLAGGAAGIIKGSPAFLFGSVSAIQTFALGSTFSACRTTILEAWTTKDQELTPRDLTKASSVAGGVTGGLVGMLTRGRSNAIPGAIMLALFGAAGQHAYNKWTAPPIEGEVPKESIWKRITKAKWSPVKLLTDEEYAEMLRGKLLNVEVEISIIDDKIKALRNDLEKD